MQGAHTYHMNSHLDPMYSTQNLREMEKNKNPAYLTLNYLYTLRKCSLPSGIMAREYRKNGNKTGLPRCMQVCPFFAQ